MEFSNGKCKYYEELPIPESKFLSRNIKLSCTSSVVPTSGVPVFRLCEDKRVVMTPLQGEIGDYLIKLNLCTDRDVHDISISPYFFYKKGNRITYVNRNSTSPWDFSAMSREVPMTPGGRLPIEVRPDTLFIYLDGSLRNNDEKSFKIDMAYFSVWGTNLWYGAAPDLHKRMRDFVNKYMRRDL